MICRKSLALLTFTLGVQTWGPGGLRAETPNVTAVADRLIAAYPAFLARREGNALVWRDGKRMVIDDGLGPKTPAARLDAPDLKDMLIQPYPAGVEAPPARDVDPGRARNSDFFTAMYGDCRRDEVRKNLVPVVWLPKKWGKSLQVTRVNGAAERLAAVSAELDALPARFDVHLYPAAGTYNCRAIAGTERVSPHGLGIAIDISTREADYWRWGKPDADGLPVYRNRIPQEIVTIFEKHGFIWGGKWYHYDTMHFEYRPELLPR